MTNFRCHRRGKRPGKSNKANDILSLDNVVVDETSDEGAEQDNNEVIEGGEIGEADQKDENVLNEVYCNQAGKLFGYCGPSDFFQSSECSASLLHL